MRWALAMAVATLLAVIMLVKPAPACADSWELPKTSITTSCAKRARLIITPRDLSSQIDYWEDKATERTAPGQRSGGTNHATARLEKLVGHQWHPVWQTRLTNEVAPVEALVRDDGSFAVTFDNWHTVDPVPVLYPARMRDLALHRPGLTPADEANSAGVMNPRDV